MKRIAVVGAGIAGLCTTYYLHKQFQQEGRPLEIVLLEKEGRLGGTILTEKMKGCLIEGGPDCFLSEKPWALQLCRTLGLEGELTGTNQQVRRAFILWKGKLYKLPEGFMLLVPTAFWPFIKSSLVSPLGKLRMGLDLILPRRGSDEEESLADFVRRRLGKEALERIAEPLAAGIHAGNPETMSLKSTFPRFIDLEKGYRSLIWGMYQRRKRFVTNTSFPSGYSMFLTLREGLEQMVSALARTLPLGIVSMNREVVELEKMPGDKGGAVQYHVDVKGDQKGLTVDALVIATPSYTAGSILKKVDEPLSHELLSIPYCSTATINLAYHRTQIGHPLDGYGFVVPRVERRAIMATTFSSVKFPQRAPEGTVLLRSFVGGANNEELVSLNDEQLLSVVRQDIDEILQIAGEPFLVRIFRWEKAMPQYILRHEERLAHIEKLLVRNPGLFLTGSPYRGIGISDCVHEAKLTAEKILQLL
jgi:oxygen-dependent protoporphyrinogen oxidase